MAKLLLLFCVVLPPAAFGHPLQFSSHPVTTVIPEDRPARFVVIGDFGTKEYGPEDRQEIVARVMREYHQRKAWDFGITVGDNFYPRGLNSENHVRWRRDWEDVYGPLGICFYPTLGNHDWRSGPEAQLNYTSSSWSMPGTYYTLRAGPMQLFALDTEDLAKKPEQLEWLEDELGASRAPWKIVYAHHPLYSAGWHGASQRRRDLLLPLLDRYAVQVYISGHEHDIQHLEEAGRHYFVVGGAGKKPRRIRPGPRSRFGRSAHGFGIFDATHTSLKVTFVLMPLRLDPANPQRGVEERSCTLTLNGSKVEDNCPAG